MTCDVRALSARSWNVTPLLGMISGVARQVGESLVRLEAAAVSHLDLTVLGGEFRIRPELPYVGGVEGAGVIVESDYFAAGTRVALRGGGIGLTRTGTWAEYIAVPDSAIRVIRPELPAEVAATSFSPLTTASIALNDVGRLGHWDPQLPLGDEVVIVTGAAGAVGAAAIQFARLTGATVIGVVSRPERVAAVPMADEVIALSDKAAVARLAARRDVTMLIDTVGGAGLGERIGWVRPGGRVVVVGYTAGTGFPLDLPSWLLGDVSLLPVNLIRREARAREIIDELDRLVIEGKIRFAVETFDFSHADEAFARLRSGEARGKVALIY